MSVPIRKASLSSLDESSAGSGDRTTTKEITTSPSSTTTISGFVLLKNKNIYKSADQLASEKTTAVSVVSSSPSHHRLPPHFDSFLNTNNKHRNVIGKGAGGGGGSNSSLFMALDKHNRHYCGGLPPVTGVVSASSVAARSVENLRPADQFVDVLHNEFKVHCL